MACWKTNATDDDLKASCRDLHQQITLSIYLLVFRALEGLLRVAGSCKPTHHYSLSRGSLFANHRSHSAQSLLMARYTKVVANLEAAQSGTMDVDGSGQGEPEVFATELDEAERCAACQEAIPFSQLGRGICRNGHVWSE